MNSQSSHETTQFEQLRKRYLDSVPNKLKKLDSAWQSITAGDWCEPALDDLKQEVHRIAGSSGSYGFHALSETAIALENQLLRWYQTPDDPELRRSIERGYAKLAANLEQLSQAGAPDISAHPILEGSRQKTKELVFLVEDDLEQVDSLHDQLESRGYRIRVFTGTGGVHQAVEQEQPSVVIFDIMFPEGELAGLELTKRLSELPEPRPEVIFLSTRTDFEARLQAVRSGSVAYMVKPISLPVLLSVLDRLLERADEPRSRVLIAENDADSGEFHQLTLQGAGIDAVRVDNPSRLIENLANLKPDLVLMDLRLPGCNSLDLVRMIRQYCFNTPLPIILLAPESDDEVVTRALQAGADDCLTQPPSPALLTSLVQSRLGRFREVLRVTDRDHLTGVLTRAAFLDRLGSEVVRAKRLGMPLVLVMIDLDDFKRVNDDHGHLAGDAVLRQVADLLVRRLRKTDLIGRYSGDEFILLLPDTQGSKAWQILDAIRCKVAESTTETQGGSVRITVSIGGAAFNPETSDVFFVAASLTEELFEAADAALYQAKRGGRNRVVLNP